MKFKSFIIGLFMCIVPTFAGAVNIADINYPTLPKTGADIQAFMPNNWFIETIVLSDFNNDGREDVVLVLRRVKEDDVLLTGPYRDGIYIRKPRILAVLFKEENGYKLELQNNKILSVDSSNDTYPSGVNEPIYILSNGVIEGNKDVLSLVIGYSSQAKPIFGTFTYTFQYQDQKFKLIGYDFSNRRKGPGQMYDVRFNLVTGKCGVSKNLISDGNENWVWRDMPIKPLMTLDQLDNSARFDCSTLYDKENN